MGNATSKKSNRQRRARPNDENSYNSAFTESSDDMLVDSVQKFDEQIIETIKKDLYENPELFVLNNMLMSVMFFENYQKEVQELSSKRYQKDGEYIAPDILFEKVNKNVLYRPLHGPKKLSSEPLVPKRLYVVNDVVQVVHSLESVPINTKKATVRVEDATRKGYVKLKEVEASSTPTENEDIPLADNEPTPSTSRDSTESDSYGYSTITDIKTPKPIEIIRGLEKQDGKIKVPPSCISYRKIRKTLTEVDLEDKEIENITDDDLYDIVTYINSKGFMRFFQNNIFPNGVGTSLGFEDPEVRLAKSIPGKIFCSLTEDDNVVPCEVIPALSAHWPLRQTLQFIMKPQQPTNAKRRYIFPTQRMINEIEALKCVLVPKGYIRKKGIHTDSDLEWEVQFPQAERYLETFMSHAQMKCYLYFLVLHKTYIDPNTSQLGLLTEHIRSFILWECEANYSDWPEHRLGTKMITLIKNFNGHIAKCDLRDFFVKEKNVFENIPQKYLRHSQRVFHDILEAPVMSFLKALRNLRYTRGRYFYHPFDFNKLHDILKKTGMESTNPQILSEYSIPPYLKKKRFADSDTQIKHLKELEKREKMLKKRQQEANEKTNLKPVEERRGSVDSIDMSWTCDKQFDVYKTRTLLMFFIETYIDIAKKCSQISSHKQTLFYLKQARYLTRIMKDECPALEVEEHGFIEKINALEDECNMRAVKENSPNIIENGNVHFAPIAEVSNVMEKPGKTKKITVEISNAVEKAPVSSTVDNASKTKKVPNGITKPRKSVMFVESH